MITVIDQALLAEVNAEAQLAPRRRKNRNFHPATACSMPSSRTPT